MLSRLDTDGDGNISQAELPDRSERAERMFTRADTNEDGTISAEEFSEARPERGNRRGHGNREGRRGQGDDG
jgi:Ca2+-binding EF-hand superfamily protein